LTIDTTDLAAFDRVVLLSDPGDPGSDDRTTVRLLRIADVTRCRNDCRLVVQVESESRAVLLTDALHAETSPDGTAPLSVLAAEQVRAHFLAHAVLTPGLVPVLDELLAERGQEFVRLVPRAGATLPHEPVAFDELLVALGRRGPGAITAIGWVVDRPDGPHPVLNPPPDVPPPYADEVRSVFAMADTSVLTGRGPSG
jgi:hypothetical protein